MTVKKKTPAFFSLKNQSEFSYQEAIEQQTILLLEFDSGVAKYARFEFWMVDSKNFTRIESKPAFKVDRINGNRQFIVISDTLVENRILAPKIKEQFQKFEPLPIELIVRKGNEAFCKILTTNLSFLYPFACVSQPLNECLAVAKFFRHIPEAPIGLLRKCLPITANTIYYLLFHGGLRADLSQRSISDDTVVSIGPLIEAVLKNLVPSNGGAK